MFSKAKPIAIAVLLLLIISQSVGDGFFVPKALAVTPTGHEGQLLPWDSDDKNQIISSENLENGSNQPSGPAGQQDDVITYHFQAQGDYNAGDNHRIVLAFDGDEKNKTNGHYSFPFGPNGTIVSATPSWLANNTKQDGFDRIEIHDGDGCPFLQDIYRNSDYRFYMYGSGNARCVVINLWSGEKLADGDKIEIKIKVRNPAGNVPPDNADKTKTGAGWYPAAVLLHYSHRGDEGDDGRADDRIKVGEPTWPRPNDIGNGCDWDDGFGCWFTWVATAVINFLIDAIAWVLRYFILILIKVASFLIQGAKFVNTQFVDNMYNNPNAEAAHIGFNIMLGLTNIGFVFAIIMIAFATMLRREEYGLKSLPRLIIIAIIINFSSLIAVGIIDVSNRVASALSHVVAQQNPNVGSDCDADDWGCTFKSFFEADRTSNAAENTTVGGIWGGVVKNIVSVIVYFIMGMMAFFVLIATAIMLIIRYIFLTFLIILLPLALLSKIFPNLKTPEGGNHWSKWRGSFTKWVLFYPVVMLFISIAVYMASWFTTHPLDSDNSAYGIFAAVIEAIIVLAIMVGGIMVADKFGVAGADYANNMGAWATRRITGASAGLAGRGVGSIGKIGRATRNAIGGGKQSEAPAGGAGSLNLQGDALRAKVAKTPGPITFADSLAVKGNLGKTNTFADTVRQDGRGDAITRADDKGRPTTVFFKPSSAKANTPQAEDVAGKGNATIGGMKGPEQPPVPGQQPKGAETFGDLWKATETSKKIEKFKKKHKEAKAKREKDGVGRIESLGGKITAWGQNGRGVVEIAQNELKKHRGVFGGLIDNGHGFEKKEKEKKIVKKMDEIKKAYPDRYTSKDKDKQDLLDKQVRIWATQLISEEDTAGAVKKALKGTFQGESGSQAFAKAVDEHGGVPGQDSHGGVHQT